MMKRDTVIRRTFSDSKYPLNRYKGPYGKLSKEYRDAVLALLNENSNLLRDKHFTIASPSEDDIADGVADVDLWRQLLAQYCSDVGGVPGEINHIQCISYDKVMFWDISYCDTFNEIDYQDITVVFPDAVSAVEFKLMLG